MSRLSRRKLARATVRLLHEQPSNRKVILRSVAAYMVQHRQSAQVDLLVRDIARELQTSQAHLFTEVTSAFALDGVARTQLAGYLKRTTGARTVELCETIDSALLGGMVVRTADLELDTSARRKLIQLASLNSKGDN